MSLQQQKFLFIDCQTTGMHPSLGEMLELSWCVCASVDPDDKREVKSRLIQVSELPSRVREITGITEVDLAKAVTAEAARSEFLADINSAQFEAAIIHYAQFEKAFLLEFLQVEELPFNVLCTHAISKRLIPNVPSRNIRALSGYFGAHFSEVKRSADHLQATFEIWRGLAAELEEQSLVSVEQIEEWLHNVKAKKSTKYEYNIDRAWRLGLPKSPGIYRMLAKNGEILYVGKATSLKDRVNSYFRGMKGREKRKLEMIAQAHKIEITECGSALEAALLESDEIKKYNPPYNVALKEGNKYLVYYSRDFESTSDWVDNVHMIGPFRKFNAIEDLKVIGRWQRDGDSRGVFYDLLSNDELCLGFEEFTKRWPQVNTCKNLRSHLVLAFKILKRHQTELPIGVDEADDEVIDETDVEENLTPEEVADKFERAYARAAHNLRRAREMTRLLNCEVQWSENHNLKSLRFVNGRLSTETHEKSHTHFSTMAWRGLGIADYDRMSIVATHLRKGGCHL